MRLRESGRRVYGIGARAITARSFANACDRFTFLEVLEGRAVETQRKPNGSRTNGQKRADEVEVPSMAELERIIATAIRTSADDNGWATLAAVGYYVVSNQPTFDSRNYGFAKFGELVKKLSSVESKDVALSNGFSQRRVRLKKR